MNIPSKVETVIMVAVMVALVAGPGYLYHLYAAERDARVTAELAVDSLEAVNDTTRLRALNELNDSINYWERRVVQVESVNDSLSEELGQTVVARNRAVARVDELETQVHGIVFEEAGEDSVAVQAARFEVRQPPYTAWAEAVMADPPILRLRIALDSIPLTIRLGCGVDGDLSRAYVGIESPEWADIQVTEAQQESNICNPDLTTQPSFWGKWGDEIVVGTGVVGGVWVLKTLYDIIAGS